MKRIIFSVFTKLKDYEHGAYSDYYDRLLSNKEEYAKSINVAFKMYDKGPDEFADINNYKLELLSELSYEYDEVMYVDFDVIFNTTENVFEEINLSNGIAVKDQNDDVDKPYKLKIYNKRSPTIKYEMIKSLLNFPDVDVINTGIIIGKSEHIQQLNFIKKFEEVSALLPTLNHPLSESFYPNNEVVFSYTLKHENIPYQILDDEWHDIRDHKPTNKPFGKIIHFINKIFNSYYDEKSKCVFSLYLNIPDEKLDNPGSYKNDSLNKSERTKLQMNKYYDQLLSNKEEYSETIGADFKMFGYNDEYKEFSNKFPKLSEYDKINLYKIWMLDKLTKEYDYVLYLDFDVVVNTDIDFFSYNNVEQYLPCLYEDISIDKQRSLNNSTYDYRAPIAKYWNARALLEEYDIFEFDNIMFNTGIVGTSRKMMQKLDYFSDIDEVIDNMYELKTDKHSFYPKNIQDIFGFDNESIFMYKCIKNNISYVNLEKWWHYKIDDFYEKTGKCYIKDDAKFLHVINKKFEKIYVD